ncbi:hypothetical protein G7Y89_g5649 [Cudoniella acicularis]|uniref:Heterokaryon incompatibility domain-containing protein n=1 Tax=Cudoniella acicularis TaxID=354080 RepID=A0A8H4RMX0_9HELO|nr:hypothetical protein G7Y89_g5649 [Cudoniella acicularis]
MEKEIPETSIDVTCPDCGAVRREANFDSTQESADRTAFKAIYSKSELRPDRKDIRLLTLLAGTFNDEIQCQLHTVSLNYDPPFTALSYCWGDAKSRGNITVNGHQVSVTESLEVALRYMRHQEEHLQVWADAICINQSNRAEKSVQVAMMGDIYAQASLVWIWLGKPADNSNVAMDFIRSATEINLDDPNFGVTPVVWLAVKTLFLRQWFQRLWVIQEALLSRKATLNCGFEAADFQCVVRIKELQTEYLTVPRDPRLAPLRSSLTSAFDMLLLNWDRLRGSISKGHISIKEVIDCTGQAKCSMQVDKIYGIMNICNTQDRQNIQIDYERCTRCLVLKVAKYNFRKFEMYGPLSVLQTHQVNKDLLLPSWVPDYVKYDYENHFVVPTSSEECVPFRAAAHNAAWVSLGLAEFLDMTWFLESCVPAQNLEVLREHVGLQNVTRVIFPQISSLNSIGLVLEDEGIDDTLILPGLIVDVVSSVHPAPDIALYTGPDMEIDAKTKQNRREDMAAECRKWRNHIRSALPASKNPYHTLSGREEAFWRTIIADRDLIWRGPFTAEEFASRFEALLGNGDRANEPSQISLGFRGIFKRFSGFATPPSGF